MKSLKQRGASYVEFAISFTMLMMIAFFFVDAGIVLYHYHFLTDRTAHFARRVSAQVATQTQAGMSCNDVAQLAQAELCLQAQLPQVQAMKFDFEPVRISKPQDSPYAVITVKSSWAVSCAVCRFFVPEGTRLHASSTLVLEDDKPDIPMSVECEGADLC